MTTLPLVVVGAGPKAAAIAAQATVRAESGESVPPVVIIEKNELAANWTGSYGFTSGECRLGTPPEKDVGYPYDTGLLGPQIAENLYARYSWGAYQVMRRRRFAEWVDRGRPHPRHSQWAGYLQWVFERSAAERIQGEVTGLLCAEHGWRVQYRSSCDGEQEIEAIGVVVTGPGPAKRLKGQLDLPCILDGGTFWLERERLFDSGLTEDDQICVIGSGETAASVVVELIERNAAAPILVINRQGTIFSRGEGYHENRLFTNPEERWKQLSHEARRQVMQRADRGVFSQDALSVIDYATNVKHLTLDVVEIIARNGVHSGEALEVRGRSPGEAGGNSLAPIVPAAWVVVAIGFDPWWFVELLPDPVAKSLGHEKRSDLVARIGADLALPSDALACKLHVPMLAGLAQGPGFPNLSCLGTLASRILRAYQGGTRRGS